MEPAEFTRRLASDPPESIYFLYGENTPQREEALAALTAALFPTGESDFDRDVFDARTHEPADMVRAVRTAPVLARRRLVIVRDAEALRQEQWDALAPVFAAPPRRATLVLIGNALPKSAIGKKLQKQACTVAFANPRWDNQIKTFVRQEFSKYGITPTADALQYFADSVGGDAGLLAREIEKTALYCGRARRVDAETAARVGAGHAVSVFTLVDSIGSGDWQRAFVCLAALLEEGTHPLALMKMIARQFRLLIGARAGLRCGESPAQIGRRIGVPQQRIAAGIIAQAKGWTESGLAGAVELLARADLELRAGRVNGQYVLENLFLGLSGLRG